ncbi:hypothetical protein HSX37_16115|uniref:Uncharacterized protein n=1 Tax=Dendrosporobacter quercicolus TaxID=146817 RepID=A0A1G9ZNG8_9FIRM|nr:hypothetical protein [Dendrosporobacter quercicolus]NSL49561.1 hypothetical protein [Dendrosporobacter quercicolus DSM 1736]SDN22784.1 hypothetical protein SAMN04488502_11516 [Dendrosporobacter quercicolus]
MANEKITETLEFLTQIHTSWNNTEQRLALRTYPRRFLSYDYIGTNSSQSQYLRALLYARQTEQIEIPLWHAGCPLPESTYLGQTQVNLKPAYLWPYRGCRGAILWFNDQIGGDRYVLQQLLGDGTLKLNEQIESVYLRARTTVYPVAYAVLQQEDQYSLYSSEAMSMQFNLELMTNESTMPIPEALDEFHEEAWQTKNPWQDALPDQYLGVELFRIGPSWTGDIAASFARNANKLDNQSGVSQYDLKGPYTSETKEIEYLGFSRSEVYNLQRFFCRCKGRLKSFYAPTWLSDMVLAEDATAGQGYLLVEWSMFWKYYAGLTRRRTIVLFMKNQTTLILTIAGFTTSDDGELGKVVLDNNLKRMVRKADVAMISFLCRYRHDSDSMTTNYDAVDLASTTFSLAEVNA